MILKRTPDSRFFATVLAAFLWLTLQTAARAQGLDVDINKGQIDPLPIAITGVGGLNDATGQAVIHGTCTTCHDSPNIGNHSVALPINIGIADASRRTPDMPLYTLTNYSTGQTVQTTDPGLALRTVGMMIPASQSTST